VRELETRLTLEAETGAGRGAQRIRIVLSAAAHLADNSLIGAEALIRWRHPVRGLCRRRNSCLSSTPRRSRKLSPSGCWKPPAPRPRLGARGRKLRIGVNLSPSQFQSGDLASAVAQALVRTGLSPTSLELEVTEDILLHDEQGALSTFLKIQALGVRIVFDDFGTGFAKLSYLKKFPLDGLKIDRSFVLGCWPIRMMRDCPTRPSGSASNWACR